MHTQLFVIDLVKRPKTFILNFFFIALSSIVVCCGTKSLNDGTESTAPSHELWDQLVHEHVSTEGIVDYKGLISDSAKLNRYLNLLSSHSPNNLSWNREEKLAYWINAYNAFTVKLIIDNYPVKSILDLNPTMYVPLLNTVWHIKFFKIGGEKLNLNEIEHAILLKEFEEPRIHFAIVCASYSCPPLRNEAFVADRIDEQLEDQAKIFINDPKRNKLTEDTIEISSIFNWFKGDFMENGSLIEFLNRYADISIKKDAEVKYMDYNWSLNELVIDNPDIQLGP